MKIKTSSFLLAILIALGWYRAAPVQAEPLGNCHVYALAPIKYVANPSWIEAHASLRCEGVQKPNTCTTHVYLQIWDFDRKTWFSIPGKDRWFDRCPPKQGVDYHMNSLGYDCTQPEIDLDFRTYVEIRITWGAHQESGAVVSGRYTYAC